MTLVRRPKNKTLVIIGAGGHATSVAEVARSAGYKIECFIDSIKEGHSLLGFPIVGSIKNVDERHRKSFIIAVGDNAIRERIANELLADINLHQFPALIHDSASVSEYSYVGNGTVLMQGARVGSNSRVGSFCILNTQSAIDHDNVVGDFASLAPGSITGGAVKIGIRSAVSIGAIVKDRITIGSDSVLGANSYLDKDLPQNVVAYGTPAKIIRSRSLGDPYLT